MEKFKTTALFCLVLLMARTVSAQSSIIHEGEITFEKRVNAYEILDEYYTNNNILGRDKFAKSYKAGNPQFGITNFTLLFNDDATLYAPNNKIPNVPEISLLQMLKTIYSDLRKNTFTAKKTVLDNDLLISDSTKKIQWKITDETREIAGFNCRRANAIIMDSVYVVAFYTDQIVPKGGPESFSGLPGMILGVALPHEHMTWFATHVIERPVPQVQPPTGGENINNSKLLQMLLDDPTLKLDKKTEGLFIRNYML